jgi:FkbM family methyltransferase
VISLAEFGRRIGNQVYKFAFPVYRPFYSAFKSYTDRFERDFLAHNLFPGAVAVDAGANVGVYSEFLARCVGPAGVVHSFEPDPTNFSRLRAALSHFPNVRLNQMAVSDKTGAALLYLSDHLNVDHRVYPTDGKSRPLRIESISLDDYFPSGDRVDLIKLDIQGYESHALRGAERVLRDNQGIKLLFELWPHGLRLAGGDWKDLILLLQRHGMTIQQFCHDRLQPVQVEYVNERPDWYVNLLAYRS